MRELENLLNCFVSFYNEVQLDSQSPALLGYAEAFRESYLVLESQSVDYLSLLDREFRDDTQLYVLVLSLLFDLTKQVKFLDKMQELLFLDHLPFDISLCLGQQIRTKRFINGFSESEYREARKLHRHFLDRLERDREMAWGWIPYEERDHKFIILDTDTLLSDKHAPTKMVLDCYKRLKYEMGYEVLLFVNIVTMDLSDLCQYWAMPSSVHYDTRLHGEFTVKYAGAEIHGLQYITGESHFERMEKLIQMVQERKPEFVWHIGGPSVMSDLFSKVTTLVSMPCVDGYSVSEAQILASCARVDVDEIRQQEEYIASCAQRTVSFPLTFSMPEEERVYSPDDFGFPENSFRVAVVGNRLDTELTEAFIEVMRQIAEREKEVHFAVIGLVNEGKQEKIASGVLKDRVRFLGYQKDLVGVLRTTHLFLNPPRTGGGSSAAYAMAAGVPVLTLPHCDVANVGDAFVCGDLALFPDFVSRYCHEEEYYKRQVAQCAESWERLSDENANTNFRQFMTQIREMIR